jgi:hypothetical protein
MVSAVLYQEALSAYKGQPMSVKAARVQIIYLMERKINITVKAMLERLAEIIMHTIMDIMDATLECSVIMATAHLNLVILARTAIVASACKVSV